MKYEDIKDFSLRCQEHPDHQSGMISESMLKQRLHEEIDELRAYIEQRTWVGLKQQDMPSGEDSMFDHKYFIAGMVYADKVLKEKNNG